MQDEARLEVCLPVVTALAFQLQDQYNRLTTLVDQPADDEARQELAANIYIVKEMLQIAMLADYGDEIGRRKMFSLIRGRSAS